MLPGPRPEALYDIRRQVDLRRLPQHGFRHKLPADRGHGQAEMAVAEIEPQAANCPRRAQDRQGVGQAWAVPHPRLSFRVLIEFWKNQLPILSQKPGPLLCRRTVQSSELDGTRKPQAGFHRRRKNLAVGGNHWPAQIDAAVVSVR